MKKNAEEKLTTDNKQQNQVVKWGNFLGKYCECRLDKDTEGYNKKYEQPENI